MMQRLLILMLFATAGTAFAQNTGELKTAPTTAIPPMKIPAPTIPPSIAAPSPSAPSAPGAPGASADAPAQDPELEITAVELDMSGVPALDDERLKPFKSILGNMAKGAAYRIISQEAKVSPLKIETEWTVNGQYSAHVLPIDFTSDGAVRLDARISVESGGKSLNALRAEGEVPPRKVMAFRGLDAGNGNELVLFLRQAPGDQQDQSGGESGESSEDAENQPDNPQAEQQGEQGEQDDQQPEDANKDEEKQVPEPKDDEQTQMAKQDEQKGSEDAAQQDDQTIEALLKSLEDEDQRQQQEARFNRQKIIIPPSGEWW